MYSNHEIDTIFSNCKNWDELEKACNAFRHVIIDEKPSNLTIWFIKRKSLDRFNQLEKS
jgi:hypothetical protein